MPENPHDDLLRQLTHLQLHYLADHLDDFIARATTGRLGPRELVGEIARLETEERRRRTVARRLSDAQIGRFKPLADFDWAWPTAIDRDAVERLMSLDFVTEPANVVLAAAQGLGKTMIAKNVAQHAVIAGHTVRFTTASAMLLDLDLGQQDGPRALKTRLRRYTTPRLLAIDEVGFLAYDNRAADLFFEVVNRRYEVGAILLTTNLAFGEWPTIFPGAACVTAMIDRITHHAEFLSIEGKSYRLKEAAERNQRRAKPPRRPKR